MHELGILRDSKLYLRLTRSDNSDETDDFMQSIAMLEDAEKLQGVLTARDGGFSGSILQKQRLLEDQQESCRMVSTPASTEQQKMLSGVKINNTPQSLDIPSIISLRETTQIQFISSPNPVTELEEIILNIEEKRELNQISKITEHEYHSSQNRAMPDITYNNDIESPSAFRSLIDMGYDKKSVRGVIGRHPHESTNELALRLLEQQSLNDNRANTRRSSK